MMARALASDWDALVAAAAVAAAAPTLSRLAAADRPARLARGRVSRGTRTLATPPPDGWEGGGAFTALLAAACGRRADDFFTPPTGAEGVTAKPTSALASPLAGEAEAAYAETPAVGVAPAAAAAVVAAGMEAAAAVAPPRSGRTPAFFNRLAAGPSAPLSTAAADGAGRRGGGVAGKGRSGRRVDGQWRGEATRRCGPTAVGSVLVDEATIMVVVGVLGACPPEPGQSSLTAFAARDEAGATTAKDVSPTAGVSTGGDLPLLAPARRDCPTAGPAFDDAALARGVLGKGGRRVDGDTPVTPLEPPAATVVADAAPWMSSASARGGTSGGAFFFFFFPSTPLRTGRSDGDTVRPNTSCCSYAYSRDSWALRSTNAALVQVRGRSSSPATTRNARLLRTFSTPPSLQTSRNSR